MMLTRAGRIGLVGLDVGVVGLAATGLAVFVWVAAHRLDYPFTLEWLESNSLVEVHRILGGQGLYVAPSAGFVPDEYPPLYFWVSSGVAAVIGQGYLALRLVSFASGLASLGLVYALVRRETGSLVAGAAGAGLLAGSYFLVGTWLDVARVDSLMLALSLAGVYAARWARGTGGALAAGALLAAACLTKQTALAVLAAVVVGLAVRPGWRRRALVVLASAGAVLAVAFGALELASRGWFGFYVFQLLAEHQLVTSRIGGLWSQLLLPRMYLSVIVLALWALAWLARRRTARSRGAEALAGAAPAGLYPLVVAALVAGSWVSYVHSGGASNDLVGAWAGTGLALGLAAGDLRRLAAGELGRLDAGGGGGAGVGTDLGRKGLHFLVGSGMPLAVSALCAGQLASLIGTFAPGAAIPTAADAAAGRSVVSALRVTPGAVWLASDPGLLLAAGKAPVAHAGAVVDVLRASGDGGAQAALVASIDGALGSGRYSALVIEQPLDLQAAPAGLGAVYQACPGALLAAAPAWAFYPVINLAVRPVQLEAARRAGGCARLGPAWGLGLGGAAVRARFRALRRRGRVAALMGRVAALRGRVAALRGRVAALRPPGPFRAEHWRSPLRGPWLTAVVSVVLGVGMGLLFLTGALSYAAYNPNLGAPNEFTGNKGLLGFYLFSWPTHPAWLFHLNQGIHVTLGVALVPVVAAKLWLVIPKLFAWPPVASLRHALERLTLGLLVGGVIFEMVTGLLNIQYWYVFPFSFYQAHLYGAWVTIGALLAHVALKWRHLREGLASRRLGAELRAGLAQTGPETPVDGFELVPARPRPATLSRRGFMGVVAAASGLLAAVTVGQTLGGRWRTALGLLAPRGQQGSGANGFPVNKTAEFLGIGGAETGPDWRLSLVGPAGPDGGRGVAVSLSRPELLGMALSTHRLTLACVEGWAATEDWTGVPLRELAGLVGAGGAGSVLVESLQAPGAFASAVLSRGQLSDPRSLLALRVNGEDLSLDHGFPARMIIPDAPGVHNTKWVSRLSFGGEHG